jgi:Domain of unknown function (DUF1918)
MRANIGDRLMVQGDTVRTGLIIGVPHADGSPPYIVKWLADGHIAMVSPGDFARIIPAARPPRLASGDSPAVGSRSNGEQGGDMVGDERL